MNLIRNRIIIYAGVVILLVLAQLFRMDIFFGINNAGHVLAHEYDPTRASTLTEAEKELWPKQHYLVLHSGQWPGERANLELILRQLGVQYSAVDTRQQPVDYTGQDTVILMEHPDYTTLDMTALLNYVQAGGHLVYLADGRHQLLKAHAPSWGVADWGDTMATNDVYFNTELLVGLTGKLVLDDNVDDEYRQFKYLDVSVTGDCPVHMESLAGVPLVWEKTLGQGKLVVLNTGHYHQKETRGLITAALSLASGLLVYPVINSQIVFIDDFPADYNSTPELLQKEYARNNARFILEIWWPDMVALMKKYGLKYTCAYVEHYTDDVVGPFVSNELTRNTTRQIVADIIKYQGEVCFHGYNHQSLLFDQAMAGKFGYRAWPDEASMTEALQKSVHDFGTMFPHYEFYTYVPPSNLLDPMAITALTKSMPHLHTIAGIYFSSIVGEDDQSMHVFTQEFGLDERYGVALPRVTSGSFYNDNTKYNTASVVTVNGVINHFIHPDDVLDPERSHGLLWEQLYRELDRFFGALHKNYGWLDKDNASCAAAKVRQYVNADIYYQLQDNVLTLACDNFDREAAVMVYTDRTITSASDCVLRPAGANRYLVLMHKNKVSLGVQ